MKSSAGDKVSSSLSTCELRRSNSDNLCFGQAVIFLFIFILMLRL